MTEHLHSGCTERFTFGSQKFDVPKILKTFYFGLAFAFLLIFVPAIEGDSDAAVIRAKFSPARAI